MSKLDFDDHFVAIRVLGKGGYGTVVLATNKLDGADYAIKQVLIRQGGICFEDAKREVKAMAQLRHSHIVHYNNAWKSEKPIGGTDIGNPISNTDIGIFSPMETSSKDSPMDISPTKNSEHFYAQWGSFGATNNEKIETNEEIWNCREGDYFLCIAMEVCHQDLLQYLERLTPDVLRQDKHLLWVAKSLENMADAVDCIHKKSWIHRDLKPQNILLTSEGEVKITDFGLAKLQSCDTWDGRMERHSDGKGTTLYWSPEQSNGKNYSNKIDIYALGLILIVMLNPHLPSPEEEFKKIREGNPPPNFHHAEEFANMLRSMLSPRPDDRPNASQIVRTCRVVHRIFAKKIADKEVRPIKKPEPKPSSSLRLDALPHLKLGALPHLKQKRLNKGARK